MFLFFVDAIAVLGFVWLHHERQTALQAASKSFLGLVLDLEVAIDPQACSQQYGNPAPKMEAQAQAGPSTAPHHPVPASSSQNGSATSHKITETPESPKQTRSTGRDTWAIWSRRPTDPTNAPGVIISPFAQPPPDVVSNAIELPTPPPTPPPPTIILPPTEDTEETTDTDTLTHTHPGSPVSSSTSIEPTASDVPDAEKSPVTQASPAVPPTSLPPTEGVTATPVPAPTPTAPKKSWASLLQSSGPSTGKSALPTSSIVGFSIPAQSTPPSAPSRPRPNLPFTASQRSEILSLLTSGPNTNVAGSVGDIQPRGLVNAGNMCFANSVLQVLAYTPPAYRLFKALGKAGLRLGTLKESKDGAGAPLVESMVEFVGEFTPPSNDIIVKEKESPQRRSSPNGKGKEREWDEWEPESFIPTYIFDAMKENKRFDHMKTGQQEDAEEFLGFLLDTLEEELLNLHKALSPPEPVAVPKVKAKALAKPGAVEEKLEQEQEEVGWLEVGKRNKTVVTRTIKGAESPITRIFGGKFRSTLKSPGQKDSVIIEDWRALRLDIQHDDIHTIQDALSHLADPQPIQLSGGRPGSQQVLIDALPQILVVNLKRFHFVQEQGPELGGVVKIQKQIAFGPELVIGADVCAPTMRRVGGWKYKLFGVVYHHGYSASGGHYTLDVLHPNRFPHLAKAAPPANKTKTAGKPDGEVSVSERDPREGWIRIDDELVSDMRLEDVFNYDAKPGERDDGRCAYLLFYRRTR